MLFGKGLDRTQNLGIPSPGLCQLCYEPCTMIYKNMQVLTIIYMHILFSKQFEKVFITTGFKTVILCIFPFALPLHCERQHVGTTVCFDWDCIEQCVLSPQSPHLAAGVGRPAWDPRGLLLRPGSRRPGTPLGSPGPGCSAPVTWAGTVAPRQS